MLPTPLAPANTNFLAVAESRNLHRLSATFAKAAAGAARRPVRRSCLRFLGLLLSLGCLCTARAATSAPPEAGNRVYIVQLQEAPAASYQGGVSGLSRTMVPEGARLDTLRTEVQAYRSYLALQRAAVVNLVGGNANVVHHFDLGFNGFAIRLTDAQARQLQANSMVRSVHPSRLVRVSTVSTPHFLGLDVPGGAWSLDNGLLKGEDVIIANIDTGVQPEDFAFLDHVDASGKPVASGGTLAYGPVPAKWKGTCQTGPGFPRTSCNNKLIGARVFNAGFLANAEQSGQSPWFGDYYDVPRDEDGHGSHTLSTAGGNAMAPAKNSAGVYLGTTSGMAPRARLASYKALFRLVTAQGLVSAGDESDILAAVDAAIADGVDIISYSVSGNPYTLVDAIDLAFLNATKAGIFVVAAAGNDGPNDFVAHPNPWLTTVAASTHDRNPFAKLSLGNGVTVSGPSFNADAMPRAPMVAAESIPAAGVSAASARLCAPGSLNPLRAAGKLVVCERGGIITRVDKGNEVKRAGGVGMALLNNDQQDDPLYADIQVVPTVMLSRADAVPVRAYAAVAGAVGSIGARYQVAGVIAPVMADFSSRGPNLAEPYVMKPDITAPGVSVIASFAYQQKNAFEHDRIRSGSLIVPPLTVEESGTSMSTPHVAGIAALIKQMHPLWSPAMIKSALMTTAAGVKHADGSADTDGTAFGAGHVNPNAALATDLVYPLFPNDYTGFLCGSGWLSTDDAECRSVQSIAPQDFNLPSIAGEIAGSTTFSRYIRNTGAAQMTVTPSATLPGFKVTVEPPTMTLTPGVNGKFKVTVKQDSALYGQLSSGTLAWGDGRHVVSSPLQATAVQLQGPSEVSSASTTGSLSYQIKYGFGGKTETVISGLKPPKRVLISNAAPATETCVDQPLVKPAALYYASLYTEDLSLAGGDFVIYLVDNATGAAIYSTGISPQVITAPSLPAGSYRLCFFSFYPDGFNVSATINTWNLSKTDSVQGFRVTGLPQGTATSGQTYTAKASWSNLTPGVRYVGVTSYGLPDGSLAGLTVVSVDPGASGASHVARHGSAYAAAHPVVTKRKPGGAPVHASSSF